MSELPPENISIEMITNSMVPFILQGQEYQPVVQRRFSTRDTRAFHKSFPDQGRIVSVVEVRERTSRIGKLLGHVSKSWFTIHVIDGVDPEEHRNFFLHEDGADVVRGDGWDLSQEAGPMNDDEELLLKHVVWRLFQASHNDS